MGERCRRLVEVTSSEPGTRDVYQYAFLFQAGPPFWRQPRICNDDRSAELRVSRSEFTSATAPGKNRSSATA